MKSAREPPGRLNLLIAGMFAVGILGTPAALALNLSRHDFYPGGHETGLFSGVWIWLFLHSALVAWGALRTRPKAGHEFGHRFYMSPLLVQACIWLLVWVFLLVRQLPAVRPRLDLDPLEPLFVIVFVYWFFGAPIIAGLQFFSSRRNGILLLGQLVPLAWTVYAFASGLAFAT